MDITPDLLAIASPYLSADDLEWLEGYATVEAAIEAADEPYLIAFAESFVPEVGDKYTAATEAAESAYNNAVETAWKTFNEAKSTAREVCSNATATALAALTAAVIARLIDVSTNKGNETMSNKGCPACGGEAGRSIVTARDENGFAMSSYTETTSANGHCLACCQRLGIATNDTGNDGQSFDTVGFFCGDDCYLTGVVADVTAQDFEDNKDGRKQSVKAFGRFFATWQEWQAFLAA